MALSSSKRVSLTKKIIAHLEDEDWPLIDLTLKQFDFPTTDTWSGNTQSYLVEMLSKGNDAKLVELADHCDGKDGTVADELLYWTPGTLRVFISHLSAKQAKAGLLQDALDEHGMSSFVAHRDVHPTLEWQAEIETALQTCELMVALIHPDFHDSDWCDQEIGWALGRGIPVFTVRIGADPKGFVSRFQAFTGAGKKPEAIASEIFEAALAHKMLQARMAEIAVTRFVESGHFHVAKARIAVLEKLKYWDPSFSKRIKKAAAENYEIEHAFGVPERVNSLIAKWKKLSAAA